MQIGGNFYYFYATKPHYVILDLVCFRYHIDNNSISGALMLWLMHEGETVGSLQANPPSSTKNKSSFDT